MADPAFVMSWREFDASIRCEPTEHNRHIFDWFLKSLPITTVQLHTLVAGCTIYMLNLPFVEAAPWREEDAVIEDISQTPVGRISLFMTAGKVGGMGAKYGFISEYMSYPTFSQVRQEDLPTMARVGDAIWRNLVGPKKIVLVELTRA